MTARKAQRRAKARERAAVMRAAETICQNVEGGLQPVEHGACMLAIATDVLEKLEDDHGTLDASDVPDRRTAYATMCLVRSALWDAHKSIEAGIEAIRGATSKQPKEPQP